MKKKKTEKQLREDKYRRVMNAKGVKFLVDAAPVREHAIYLHEHPSGGMTQDAIARKAGLSQKAIHHLIVGQRKQPDGSSAPVLKVRRHTADAILAVHYEPPEDPGGPARVGAYTDPTGTQRRMQALAAIGFGAPFQADFLGNGARASAYVIMHGHRSGSRRGYVMWNTALQVSKMYDKLSGADPLDFGQLPHAVAHVMGTARNHGWAPPGCWDSDTINDPEAIPEWTGRCGTPRGYRIHRREDIPVCGPCLHAIQEHEPFNIDEFDRFAFKAARISRGLSQPKLAALLGVSAAAVGCWELGKRHPSEEHLRHLLAVLDVMPDYNIVDYNVIDDENDGMD